MKSITAQLPKKPESFEDKLHSQIDTPLRYHTYEANLEDHSNPSCEFDLPGRQLNPPVKTNLSFRNTNQLCWKTKNIKSLDVYDIVPPSD